MDKMMYMGAQYLAAAGISFLEKKQDDSHTNLGFVIGDASLNSRPLNKDGDILSLSYENFSLAWKCENGTNTISLDDSSHRKILDWIEDQVATSSLDQPFKYSFHYDFPYEIDDNFIFSLTDTDRLRELTHLRILAQLVMEKFLAQNQLDSEIRVWPHHFDTGIYAEADRSAGLSVGAGLAIPDNVVDEHYFYISGYKDNDAIATGDLEDLSYGQWHNEGFTGATLPAKEATEEMAVDFLQEALEQFKSKVG